MPEQYEATDSLATAADGVSNGARGGVQAIHQALCREGFERYQKRRAENTLRRQRADMALFEGALADVGIPVDHLYTDPNQWQSITFALVEHFLEWRLEKGYAIASINGRLATLKKYAAVACQLGVLPSDELFRIREVKGFRRVEGRRIDLKRSVTRIGEKKAEPTFLTEEQLAALFQVPDLRTLRGWRDLLLLRLSYDLGLRPGEIVSMQLADLDVELAIVHVRRHKTDGEQFLRLTPGIIVAASHYLQGRRDLDPAAPLIVKASYAGGLVELMKRKDGQVVTVPLGLRGVCARVHLLGLAISVNLNAYDARHQWTRDAVDAVDAVDAGNALVDILTAGGWSKDSPMVRRYSGERTIANERIQLKRDAPSSDSPCPHLLTALLSRGRLL